MTDIFLNERKEKTELGFPVEVEKFYTKGSSWRGVVCGSIIAKCRPPASLLLGSYWII